MPCPILRQSGGFKPVLVNVDKQGVGRITGVLRPEIGLAQTDSVERLARQAVPAVGQRFGVGIDAAERVDGTGMSLDIGRRAEMMGRRAREDSDGGAVGVEPSIVQPIPSAGSADVTIRGPAPAARRFWHRSRRR